MAKGDFIAQERRRWLGLSAEVVRHRLVDEHLGGEFQAVVPLPVGGEEQIGDLPGGLAGVADLQGRLVDAALRQQGQEVDGVEDIGLAGAVGTGNAGVRSEIEHEVDQILESVDLQPREHDDPPIQ